MEQTKLGSLIEAVTGTTIGFAVSLLGQLVFFPQVGINVSFSVNIKIGAFFTLISILRGYVLRRWFNARLRKAANALASAIT